MANVEMRLISKSKPSKGVSVVSKSEQTTYTKSIVPGSGMYVFIYGKGSKRKSVTRHMTEQQALKYKNELEKA